MARYILRRLLMIVITLFLILTVTFLLLQLLPGSPFQGDKVTPEQLALMEAKYGLDDPVWVQYGRYMWGFVRGDMGISFKNLNRPVSDLILAKVPVTARLGLLALIVGTIIGIFLGAIAAINRNGLWDNVATVLAVVGVSIPSFVFAAVLQYYVGYKWGVLPLIYSRTDLARGITPWMELKSMILPAIAMAIWIISSTMRFTRTELVEVLNSEYILLARAKGLSRTEVIIKHALRNAMIPIVTIVGPMTVVLLSGSTVIERFFGVPGLAQLLIQSVLTRDYFVILGIAFTYSAMFVFIILVVDILYVIIDPRIRLVGGKR